MNEVDYKLLYEQVLEQLEEETRQRETLEKEVRNLLELLKNQEDRFVACCL